MNAKALIPLIAGLGIGGLALKMGLDTLRKAQGTPRATNVVELWVPTENIPRGTEVTEEKLKLARYPGDMVPMGAMKEKKQIVGRVVDLDAVAGLPVLETMLLAPGERVRVLPKPGFRAVAINVDESSNVGNHLEPGCSVDVTGTVRVRQNNRTELAARTIIENVEVLAVGPRLTPQTGKEADEKDKNSSRNAVRAVTLSVRPEDVQKLLLAEQQGKLKLSLRNGDESSPPRENVTAAPEPVAPPEPSAQQLAQTQALVQALNEMFEKALTPRTGTRKAAPPWVVTVYKGGQRSDTIFKDRYSREPAMPAAESSPRRVPTRAPAPAVVPNPPTEPEPQSGTGPEPQESLG